ncbi:MAG: hypothetical protein IPK19_15450 [Chloroflexi bacterium]|nr:hypothetical protein [Chloroflexota bacterium]
MSRTRTHIAIALLLLWAMVAPAYGQVRMVYGVFFYSPSCAHCHEVITKHWDGIQNQFGDQLQVLFIDVTTQAGSQLMSSARSAMNIASNGVPMLIIGSNVLVGSVEIPTRTADIVRAGLDAGGIGYPPIPGIEEVFDAALAYNAQISGEEESTQATDSGEAATLAPAETGNVDVLGDPANLLAIGLLLVLLASLVVMLMASSSTRARAIVTGRGAWYALMLGILSGALLTASLMLGSTSEPGIALIAGAAFVLFVISGGMLLRQRGQIRQAKQVLPLIALAGLLVAGYLAYVETTLSEAVCGAFGNCNAVQQSPYAQIAGVPIGVIGIAGYLLILAIWALGKWRQVRWADSALFVIALLGTVFSLYLTSLEPFVIGATCVWCLTSSVVMGILLWMTAPALDPNRDLPTRSGKQRLTQQRARS